MSPNILLISKNELSVSKKELWISKKSEINSKTAPHTYTGIPKYKICAPQHKIEYGKIREDIWAAG